MYSSFFLLTSKTLCQPISVKKTEKENFSKKSYAVICFSAEIIVYLHGETITFLNFDIMAKIIVQDTPITITKVAGEDYISLTDMAGARRDSSRAADVIKNWIRNRSTLEFLGIWEVIHNPNFNVVEFDHFRMQAGLHSFVLSVQEWIDKTNAIGITVQRGRYGGTYAHRDIAYEFGTAISVAFKLYLIQEIQRFQKAEQKQLAWDAKRELSKINYRIHTDAIKANLIPAEVTSEQVAMTYADEADVLNIAMFGITAKEWREQNPGLKGNIRDYASINELICLSNMENLNAVFIGGGMPQNERLVKLNHIAIQQMQILLDTGGRKLLQ